MLFSDQDTKEVYNKLVGTYNKKWKTTLQLIK
jgi:hypothetical protein